MKIQKKDLKLTIVMHKYIFISLSMRVGLEMHPMWSNQESVQPLAVVNLDKRRYIKIIKITPFLEIYARKERYCLETSKCHECH